jgi:hypothetical protein
MQLSLNNLFATLTVIALLPASGVVAAREPVRITIVSKPDVLMHTEIQKAIDSCSLAGGGIVHLTSGTFTSGTIELKSNVTLYLAKGAILKGSDSMEHYHNDAFIYALQQHSISIEGPGTIDGADVRNPRGEEGFRGPHGIRLVKCTNIRLKGFTIERSGNWAINCRHCSGATVEKIKIRGGHDGLHTRFCEKFSVTDCDFRTGDDAFAGSENRDFTISNCKINTSCNGFRLGCLNLMITHCALWGPGEYAHKIQNRTNMLSAFVHFSPTDENPAQVSGNWKIKNVTVKNVDRFYVYNFETGLWQTGKPVTNLVFENIQAVDILNAFSIIGDEPRQISLQVKDALFSFRNGAENAGLIFEGERLRSPAFFNAFNFDHIILDHVTLKKNEAPLLECVEGNQLTMKRVTFSNGGSPDGYKTMRINKINISNVKFIQ